MKLGFECNTYDANENTEKTKSNLNQNEAIKSNLFHWLK